jgi:hypothetical protein
MLSHSLSRFHATPYVFSGAALDIWHIFVRIAPPTFILLFGALLQIIYVRIAEKEGLRKPAARLFQRGIQCYLLFAATVAVMAMTGEISIGYFFTNLALAGVTPFTDILKFYSITCFLAPLLIYVRMRFGVAPLMIGVVAIQLLHSIIFNLPSLPELFGRDSPARLASFLFGVDDLVPGPSILQGSFLVIMGMQLGSIIARPEADRERLHRMQRLALLAGALAVCSFVLWLCFPTQVTLAGFTGMALRNSNHPFYYTAGALGAVLLVILLLRLNHQDKPGHPLRLSMIGQQSLFTFSVGNAILYLMPAGEYGFAGSVLRTAGAFALIYAATALYDRLIQPSASDSPSGVIRMLSYGLKKLLGTINTRIAKVANWAVDLSSTLKRAVAAPVG